MKKVALILFTIFTVVTQAQEIKQFPTINVSGEGKINIGPDEALISISVETKGTNVADIKKENDGKIEAILKLIKKNNINKEDYQTQRVTLNPNYDYEKKNSNYIAVQTIQILLRDLTQYDVLMEGLVGNGVNRIDNVAFQSSKIKQLQSDARKLAVKDAKSKAEDFVSVLGQKVGKAITISDNSPNYNPPPIMYTSMKTMAMSDGAAPRETLATGEIEIIANVSVSFVLE